MTSELKPESVLTQIAQSAAQLIDADKAAIWRISPDSSRLDIVAAVNLSEAYRQHSLAIGEGVVGAAVSTRGPVVVADALNDQRLVAAHLLQTPDDLGRADAAKIVALAARDDREGDFLGVRGGEHEDAASSGGQPS